MAMAAPVFVALASGFSSATGTSATAAVASAFASALISTLASAIDTSATAATASAPTSVRRRSLAFPYMKCSKRATSVRDPKQTCVRWSIPVIGTSSAETHFPSHDDAPPAFSTSSAMGAASNDSRSFAFVDGDAGSRPGWGFLVVGRLLGRAIDRSSGEPFCMS